MNAHSFVVSKGLQSLKQLSEVTGTTQKRLKELYVSDAPLFDFICTEAFHKLQVEQVFLDSMMRHRHAVAI